MRDLSSTSSAAARRSRACGVAFVVGALAAVCLAVWFAGTSSEALAGAAAPRELPDAAPTSPEPKALGCERTCAPGGACECVVDDDDLRNGAFHEWVLTHDPDTDDRRSLIAWAERAARDEDDCDEGDARACRKLGDLVAERNLSSNENKERRA